MPRTSTLLAALWPHHHAVIDWRSLSAAFALVSLADGWAAPLPDPTSADPVGSPSWANYGWYRDRVLAEAAELGRRPAEIERALFILTKDVPSVTGRPWADYAHAVHAARQQLPPAAI